MGYLVLLNGLLVLFIIGLIVYSFTHKVIKERKLGILGYVGMACLVIILYNLIGYVSQSLLMLYYRSISVIQK